MQPRGQRSRGVFRPLIRLIFVDRAGARHHGHHPSGAASHSGRGSELSPCRTGRPRILLSVSLRPLSAGLHRSPRWVLLLGGRVALALLPDLTFHMYSDRPDKPHELAGHGGDRLLRRLALGDQPPIAPVEPMLRLPADLLDLFGEARLALL